MYITIFKIDFDIFYVIFFQLQNRFVFLSDFYFISLITSFYILKFINSFTIYILNEIYTYSNFKLERRMKFGERGMQFGERGMQFEEGGGGGGKV